MPELHYGLLRGEHQPWLTCHVGADMCRPWWWWLVLQQWCSACPSDTVVSAEDPHRERACAPPAARTQSPSPWVWLDDVSRAARALRRAAAPTARWATARARARPCSAATTAPAGSAPSVRGGGAMTDRRQARSSGSSLKPPARSEQSEESSPILGRTVCDRDRPMMLAVCGQARSRCTRAACSSAWPAPPAPTRPRQATPAAWHAHS